MTERKPRAPRKAKKVEEVQLEPLAGIGSAATNAVVKSGFFKELLVPPGKVLGAYLGRSAQHFVDKLEAKREGVLSVHFEKVQKVGDIDASTAPPSEKQFVALVNWTEHAQSVDPASEPELAALWQSLLADIVNNHPLHEEMAAVLKNMTRADAMEFLRYARALQARKKNPVAILPANIERFYLNRFRNWGLVDTSSNNTIFLHLFLLISSVILTFISFNVTQIDTPYSIPNDIYLMFVVFKYIGPLLFASMCLALFIERNTQNLTKLGMRLFKSSWKYI